jgi:hypothetical protein
VGQRDSKARWILKMSYRLNSAELITIAVLEDIIKNWVFPQTDNTKIALTWMQEYVENVKEGKPITATGDETLYTNE